MWAVSSLKRNTGDVVDLELIEDFLRGSKAKDSARPAVQGVFDGGELSLSDGAQVHALGQVLSDEAIGILVRTTQPRAMRVAEEDVHVQRERPVCPP